MTNRIRNQPSLNKSTIKINEWIDKCKVTFSFITPSRAIHNQDEFLLSCLTGLWLLQFLNNDVRIKTSTEVFTKLKELKRKYPQAKALWEFLNGIFKFLNKKMILDSLLLINIPFLHKANRRYPLLSNRSLQGTHINDSASFIRL